jgi:hypothetical protein
LTAWPEHFEGENCLIGEITPVWDWEGFWKTSNAREKVILPRTNFVYVGWGVLAVCVLFANEGFDVMKRLVFHLVKLWFEAPHAVM